MGVCISFVPVVLNTQYRKRCRGGGWGADCSVIVYSAVSEKCQYKP